jgi:hypothetical protein
MIRVIVMVVANAHQVDFGNVLDIARGLCVPFGPDELARATPVREDGIKQDSEAAREFDVVACVAEPRRAEFGGGSGARGGEDGSDDVGGGVCPRTSETVFGTMSDTSLERDSHSRITCLQLARDSSGRGGGVVLEYTLQDAADSQVVPTIPRPSVRSLLSGTAGRRWCGKARTYPKDSGNLRVQL